MFAPSIERDREAGFQLISSQKMLRFQAMRMSDGISFPQDRHACKRVFLCSMNILLLLRPEILSRRLPCVCVSANIAEKSLTLSLVAYRPESSGTYHLEASSLLAPLLLDW